MVFTTVRVYIHEPALGSHSFEDWVSDLDGKFYNFGVQTLAALKAHKTIDVYFPAGYDGDAYEDIIPYHAVLDWSVTKEEGEYTKPEDDFCKSESTPTGDITLLDGTYTFEQDDDGYAAYGIDLAKCYEPANVTVTVNGTTVTLPKVDGAYGGYGEIDEQHNPIFTTYPAYVQFINSAARVSLFVAVPTAGEHTVNVTIPSGSEVECPQS